MYELNGMSLGNLTDLVAVDWLLGGVNLLC